MRVVPLIGLALWLPISFSVNASLPFGGHFISGVEFGTVHKTDRLEFCQSYLDGSYRRNLFSFSERDQIGTNMGSFLGYEILYKRHLFGLESSVNWGNDYLKHTLNAADGKVIVSTQRDGNYLISLRYGYTAKNGSIFYYRQGMQCVNDKLVIHYRDLQNSPIGNSVQVRDINWRWSVGLGVEHFLFNKKNTSIRGEFYAVSGGSPRYYSDGIIDYGLNSWSRVCKVQWVWHFI